MDWVLAYALPIGLLVDALAILILLWWRGLTPLMIWREIVARIVGDQKDR